MAIRGTTPTYSLSIDGYDLTNATVYVTFSRNGKLITKTGSDLSVTADENGSTIVVMLTQKETLALKQGTGDVQVRFIYSDGEAKATSIEKFDIKKVLLEKVIDYNGGE